MKQCIAEVLETQSEIIQLQRNVIDRLAATLLQHGMIEEEELAMMQQAADLQRGIVSIHTSAREVTAIFRKKLFQFL